MGVYIKLYNIYSIYRPPYNFLSCISTLGSGLNTILGRYEINPCVGNYTRLCRTFTRETTTNTLYRIMTFYGVKQLTFDGTFWKTAIKFAVERYFYKKFTGISVQSIDFTITDILK